MARLKGDTIPLLRRLWREWLSPHRGTLAVVLVLIALVGASTGLYPALIKGAFDAFDRKDAGALAYGPLIVIVVTSVRGFALFGQTVLTNRVVTRVEADMQAALYGHLIDADLAQLGRESPAAFTQRFTTDFAFIKEALTRISTVLLRDVAMLVGLVAALIWMDPVLTLVAAVTVPFVAGPIGRIGKKLRRVSTTTQEQMGATASLISESLQGVRIAKTYAMEGYLKGRAADALDSVRRLKMKAANARGRLDPLLEVGGGFAVAAVLMLVGQRVMAGERTVGDFTGYVAALLL
ncbi:ABC transporter transmembrane domain-containing protein, partial [Methylobacterium sp. WL116]